MVKKSTTFSTKLSSEEEDDEGAALADNEPSLMEMWPVTVQFLHLTETP